ncbi:MAG TPA: DUF2069 domain-containing protein [Burkholderiales bacterium]|nr:DUF2069 domain-containing protein [Burkholderiales bacterium]
MMRACRAVAGTSLVALVFLCVDWELWLAPVRPGGSLLALKALPLLLPLAGILRGRRYTYQWSSMLVLAYFAEGVVRAWSESGVYRAAAIGEILLSLIFFVATVGYARMSARKPA